MNWVCEFRSASVLACGVMLCASSAHAETVCTALIDAVSGKVLMQEGSCDRRITPASTFKIALSLMGYDAGYLVDEHLPALPFHEGYPAWIASWKSTTDPSSWMQNSVVWYSQQITEWLGETRFRRYVSEFKYGNEDVSGDPGKNNGLTRSWLGSSLEISPLEQLAFLRRVVRRELPVTADAYELTSRITALGVLSNGWLIHGKTGTGFRIAADGSVDHARQIGWFVGWATRGERTRVFAHCIQDERQELATAGMRAEEDFLRRLPGLFDSY